MSDAIFWVSSHDIGFGSIHVDIQVYTYSNLAMELGSAGILALIEQAGSSLSKESVSPLVIQMLLEAHYKPSGHWPNQSSMAHIEACKWIIDNGYVELTNDGHELTGKGKLWLARITQSPE